MNRDELKLEVEKLLKPVFDGLVEQTTKLYEAVVRNMKDLPAQQQSDIIIKVLKANSDNMVAQLKQSIPEDIGKKIQEELNGRRS